MNQDNGQPKTVLLPAIVEVTIDVTARKFVFELMSPEQAATKASSLTKGQYHVEVEVPLYVDVILDAIKGFDSDRIEENSDAIRKAIKAQFNVQLTNRINKPE